MNWNASLRDFRRYEVIVNNVFHNSIPVQKIKKDSLINLSPFQNIDKVDNQATRRVYHNKLSESLNNQPFFL